MHARGTRPDTQPASCHATAARSAPATAHPALALAAAAGNRALARVVRSGATRTLARQVSPARPRVRRAPRPTMEFISGSAQFESVVGHFTDRVVALTRRGMRFEDAARQVARGTRTLHGEHPGHSADVDSPDPFGDSPLRRAAIFGVWNYTTSDPDLPEVRQQLGPNGSATRAIIRDYGRANVSRFQNLTGAQINTNVIAVINNVRNQLAPGQRGELMLVFGGHGDSLGMEGSDGNNFTLAQLQAASNLASAANIQLIVVSDECLQGAGILLAEQMADPELRQRIDASALSARDRADLQARRTNASALVTFAQAILPPLDDLSWLLENVEPPSGRQNDLAQLRATLATYATTIQGGFPGASAALNAQIRAADALAQAVTPGQTQQLKRLVRMFIRVSDQLTGEVADTHSDIQSMIDLADL